MASRFRTVRLKSRNEFDWLIEHVSNEAYRVRDNWECWAAINDAAHAYSIEINQTPAFWEITRRAHQDAVVLRLGRLYDPHATATSLGKLLQTLSEYSSSAEGMIPAPIAELKKTELDFEMASVSEDEPSVAKLMLLRNEYLAHRGSRHVIRGTFAALQTLEAEEISTLIQRALDIIRKYRERLGYTPLIWGHYEVNDFSHLLSLLRKAVLYGSLSDS